MKLEEQELPQGWVSATISQLIGHDGVFVDGDWVESKDQDPSGEVRLIQLADIGDGEFRDRSGRFLTTAKAIELGCSFVDKNDLLVARMPDPLGRCCLFPLEAKGGFVTVVDVCIIRLGASPVDGKYLMYAINSPAIRNDISNLQSGSTRKRISRGNLATIGLPIAPLSEQRRIVAKVDELFSELDNGLESLRSAKEQLMAYRQSVLRSAFEGKLTERWRAENSRSSSDPDELVVSLRKAGSAEAQLASYPEIANASAIPKGWAYFAVSSLCSVVRGGSPRPAGDPKYYDGTIPFLKVADLTRTVGMHVSAHTSTIKQAGLAKTRMTPPNTLLISNSGATLGVPKICTFETTFNDGVAAFLGVPDGYLEYFYFFWESQTSHLRSIDQGAAQPNLNTTILGNTLIPICSKDEAARLVDILKGTLSSIEHQFEEIDLNLSKAEALRQSVLKAAFKGILVAQDPSDEPATELLKRIEIQRRDHEGKNRRNKHSKKEAA